MQREPTIGEALAAAERQLRTAGCATARLDAEILLAHASGLSRARILADRGAVLEASARVGFAALVERRARREPAAYLVGEKEFWSLPLAVDGRVLVPRPETEAVVEAALERLAGLRAAAAGVDAGGGTGAGGSRRLWVADVGTGSGAIALAIVRELGRAGAPRGGTAAAAAVALIALDRSAGALCVARQNARRHTTAGGVAVALLRSDLLCAFAAASLDLVVSNPPYLSDAQIRASEPELRYEPQSALAGGAGDGLGVVRSLIAQARRVLRPGGYLVSEIGEGQGEAAAVAARAVGLDEVGILTDLAGLERVLVARNGAAAATPSGLGGAA